MLIGFLYYVCPNCKHNQTWPWRDRPEKEGLTKCEKCGADIKWVESCIKDD